jgi:hypothetical protein
MIRPCNIHAQDGVERVVDEPPYLRLPFLKIAIETGVLQRDRRLRGEQFEDV